jgi:hypothetical protein
MDIREIIQLLNDEYKTKYKVNDLIDDIEATAWEVAYIKNKHKRVTVCDKDLYDDYDKSFMDVYNKTCKLLITLR